MCVSQVSLNSGLTPSDPEEVCTNVGPLFLAPGGFFGVSAATGILAGEDLHSRWVSTKEQEQRMGWTAGKVLAFMLLTQVCSPVSLIVPQSSIRSTEPRMTSEDCWV